MTERPNIAARPPDPEEVFRQVRANIAFGHMVVAALVGAIAGGAAKVIGGIVGMLAGVHFSLATTAAAAFDGLVFACVAFLIGFFAAIVAGLPLFLALERNKVRKTWPYVAAGLAVGLVVALALGGPDGLARHWPVFPAGLVAGLVFGRRMRPAWLAAEAAERMPVFRGFH